MAEICTAAFAFVLVYMDWWSFMFYTHVFLLMAHHTLCLLHKLLPDWQGPTLLQLNVAQLPLCSNIDIAVVPGTTIAFACDSTLCVNDCLFLGLLRIWTGALDSEMLVPVWFWLPDTCSTFAKLAIGRAHLYLLCCFYCCSCHDMYIMQESYFSYKRAVTYLRVKTGGLTLFSATANGARASHTLLFP